MLQKLLTGATMGMVLLLLGLALIMFLQSPGALDTVQASAQENGVSSGRPGGGPGGRMGMVGWLDDLEKAYKENDREKMEQMITQMKERRPGVRGGMGGRGPGMGGRGSGMGGRGPGMGPGGRPGRGGEIDGSFFNNKLMSKDDSEQKILSVLEDMDKNQRRGMMNVPEGDGRFLRLLTESLGAKTVVEIGTSNGYSGIWFCLALRKTGGKLITHEIDEGRANLAKQNFKKAGVENLVTLVEGDAHENVKKLKGSIDILFLDADKEGYIDYLNKLLPMLRPGGLILAHNINPGQADPRYIKAITTNPDLESLLINGVGVTIKKR
jgi:caffeoyl-CoA O-methyltransferase